MGKKRMWKEKNCERVDKKSDVPHMDQETFVGGSGTECTQDLRFGPDILTVLHRSQHLRLILQALGVCVASQDLETQVQLLLELSREQRLAASTSPLDFSYLADVDQERGTARIWFDVSTEGKIAETLYLIELVLESCVEAGAWLLEIELADGDAAVLLAGVSASTSRSCSICASLLFF